MEQGAEELTDRINGIRRRHGFNDMDAAGFLAILHKKGDKSAPANYRPLQMLTMARRLWGKMLVKRLNKLITQCIGREQQEGVAGRRIEENLLGLMGRLTSRWHKGAAVLLLLDQEKAFNKVEWHWLGAVL